MTGVTSVEASDEPSRKVLVVPFNLLDAELDSETLGGTADLLVPLPVAPIIDFSDSVLLPQKTSLKGNSNGIL